MGRQDEAIELYNKVIALDPLRARSYSSLGTQLYCAGRYDEANAMLQRALELNPQKARDHLTRGRVLLAQGRPQQALTEIEQETDGDLKLLGEALAYHSLGHAQDSDGALQKLIATHQKEMLIKSLWYTHFVLNLTRRLSGSTVPIASATSV